MLNLKYVGIEQQQPIQIKKQGSYADFKNFKQSMIEESLKHGIEVIEIKGVKFYYTDEDDDQITLSSDEDIKAFNELKDSLTLFIEGFRLKPADQIQKIPDDDILYQQQQQEQREREIQAELMYKKKLEEEDSKRRKDEQRQMEDAMRMRRMEEEMRQKKMEEEMRRQRMEEEMIRRKKEEEMKAKLIEEQMKKKMIEEESQRRAQLEEEQQRASKKQFLEQTENLVQPKLEEKEANQKDQENQNFYHVHSEQRRDVISLTKDELNELIKSQVEQQLNQKLPEIVNQAAQQSQLQSSNILLNQSNFQSLNNNNQSNIKQGNMKQKSEMMQKIKTTFSSVQNELIKLLNSPFDEESAKKFDQLQNSLNQEMGKFRSFFQGQSFLESSNIFFKEEALIKQSIQDKQPIQILEQIIEPVMVLPQLSKEEQQIQQNVKMIQEVLGGDYAKIKQFVEKNLRITNPDELIQKYEQTHLLKY